MFENLSVEAFGSAFFNIKYMKFWEDFCHTSGLRDNLDLNYYTA